MKCIVCGNELKGMQRKYCCTYCAQVGYYTGKAVPSKDTSKEVSELFKKYLKENNLKDSFRGFGRGKNIRAFISACLDRNYNIASIAKGINKCHTTVSKHVKKITQEDKLNGEKFLLDNNCEKKSIYPKGFTYGVKQ